MPSVNLSVAPEIVRIDAPGSAGRLVLPPPTKIALGFDLAACGRRRLARILEPAGPLRVRPVLIIIGTSPVLPVTPWIRVAERVDFRLWHEAKLRLGEPPEPVQAEIFREPFPPIGQPIPCVQIDRHGNELLGRLRRWRAEGSLRRMVLPGGLKDRLENGSRHLAACLSAPERAALAVGI